MPSPLSVTDRCLVWGGAAVLLTAIVLRAVLLWTSSDALETDPDLYREIAQHLAAGEGFARDTGPTAFRPPLYPLFLAIILICGGGSLSIGVAQLLAGVATTALTLIAAIRANLGRWSLLAGFLVAVDPILLHSVTQVMTEPVATLLAAGLVLAWMRPVGEWSLGGSLLRGALCGLAILCRPTFASFLILWWLFQLIRPLIARLGWTVGAAARSIETSRSGMAAHITLIAALTVIAPWALRNQHLFGQPVLLTTHGGYTLLLGHNPGYYQQVVNQPWGTVWDQASLEAWQADTLRDFARDKAGTLEANSPEQEELARDQWMRSRAWDNIRADPVMAFRSGLTLLGRLWNVLPMQDASQLRRPAIRWAIAAWYIGVLVLAAAGLFRLVRSPQDGLLTVALGMILGFTLVHTLYWADMRMRAPLAPVLALLAARALVPRRESN